MAKFSQERKELIEDFERNFKDVFLKTLDLATHYTGIHIKAEPEFGEFEYREGEGNKLHIVTAAEHSEGKLTINPKIMLPPDKHADRILSDYTYASHAAHEAGDLLYAINCDYVGKKYYKIEGEIVGEFFFRLFLKEYDVKMDPKVSFKFFGRYGAASQTVDNIEELMFKEQVEKIRALMFRKHGIKGKFIEKLTNLLDRLDRPR